MAKDLANLFIVAAPSGGGKTSLVKNLIQTLPDIQVSISHTTREIRSGEIQGLDYFFVSETEFLKMMGNNDFIEHAKVFNYFYGTSKQQIESRLKAGIDVVLDIDWQGAQQIKHIFPSSVSIFIVPPSLDILKQRLMARQRDNESVIEERMRKARDEMSHFPEFDYLIVNDNFEKAATDLRAVVMAERLRTQNQTQRERKLLSFLLTSE